MSCGSGCSHVKTREAHAARRVRAMPTQAILGERTRPGVKAATHVLRDGDEADADERGDAAAVPGPAVRSESRTHFLLSLSFSFLSPSFKVCSVCLSSQIVFVSKIMQIISDWMPEGLDNRGRRGVGR